MDQPKAPETETGFVFVDHVAREKADLRSATSAGDAARRLLARRGIHIPDHLADAVADAVLSHANTTVSVQECVDRRIWEQPAGRDYLLQHLRTRLLDEITSHGCLPTALPTQTLTYRTWAGRQAPYAGSDVEPPEWDQVEVTLTAPLRTPPIDRKAAVKAGLLNGEATS